MCFVFQALPRKGWKLEELNVCRTQKRVYNNSEILLFLPAHYKKNHNSTGQSLKYQRSSTTRSIVLTKVLIEDWKDEFEDKINRKIKGQCFSKSWITDHIRRIVIK